MSISGMLWRRPSGDTSKPASRGHSKTGQLSVSRTVIVLLYRRNFWQEFFFYLRISRFILISPGRRIGQRRDATRAPTQRPEWRGGASRPKETAILAGRR